MALSHKSFSLRMSSRPRNAFLTSIFRGSAAGTLSHHDLNNRFPLPTTAPAPPKNLFAKSAGYIDHSMANTSNGMIALFAAATSIRSPSCLLRLRMLHGKVDAGGAPVDFLIDLVSSSWQFWGLRPDVPKRIHVCKSSKLVNSPVSESV